MKAEGAMIQDIWQSSRIFDATRFDFCRSCPEDESTGDRLAVQDEQWSSREKDSGITHII